MVYATNAQSEQRTTESWCKYWRQLLFLSVKERHHEEPGNRNLCLLSLKILQMLEEGRSSVRTSSLLLLP